MAKDSGPSPALQKLLVGPFKGLNNTQSPFMRELPPAPNARPQEFATEFSNIIIDQKTQELIARNGIEYVEKGSAVAPAISATAGLFKWIDYDTVTGTPRERLINLTVDKDGLPTVSDYRFIKTQLRATDASLTGKKFAIIEDPDASYAKRFMIYNSDDTVFASYTTLAGVTNTSVSYVDYDSTRDGSFVLGAVDLLEPVTLTYSASNGTPATVAEFWSICKKDTVGTGINLTTWLTALSTSEATYFTAAQNANVIYFSGGGVCPQLKYDGVSLYKAGMPHAALKGDMDLTLTAVNTWQTNNNEVYGGTNGGLTQPGATATCDFVGRFFYVPTYERGDAKNNYIESKPYVQASYSYYNSSAVLTALPYPIPKHLGFKELDTSALATTARVVTYTPKSLVSTDGYDARGALHSVEDTVLCTYNQVASFTVTVTKANHGLQVGDRFTYLTLSGSLTDNLGTPQTVVSVTTNTFTYTHTSSGTTSGNIRIYPVITAALVASNFPIRVRSSANTLKAGDIVCLRGWLDRLVYVRSTERIPLLITTKLASVTSTDLTIDTTYPIQVEACPGGDFYANIDIGVFSGTSIRNPTSILSLLGQISTWSELLAFTWLGRYVSGTYFKLQPEFCISNNLRINIYRNKSDVKSLNSYDPGDQDQALTIPSVYLHNILPNNPFSSTTSMGYTYDNCMDTVLGAELELRESLALGDTTTQTPFTSANYSSLPFARWISSYKGRSYLAADPTNANILYRSSLVYGPEYYNVSDTLSMESAVGDEVTAVVGNAEAIFVLKDNSIKMIINDLQNDRIRVDDITVGDDGCIAPRSAVQLENGVAYLTSEGPAWAQVDKQLVYLGDNNNNVSRIKDLFADSTLDLKRAVGMVDTDKKLYQLYVPRITKPSSGIYNAADRRHSDNPYYVDDGLMFVYDYANDAWSTQSGINAKGGMVALEQSGGGRTMFLTAYAKNTSESESTLEWTLYKERKYDNLWSFADRIERGGTEELRAISCAYSTDWLALDNPNELKNWLRCKVYGLRTFSDLTVLGSSNTPLACDGDYTLTVTAYPNWRSDSVHSSANISLTSTNLFAFMKLRNMHANVMKFRLTLNTLFSSPRIQAIEIEAASPFKAKMKAWGTP